MIFSHILPTPQHRYANGFRWCGFCGEWRKIANVDLIKAAVRCPDCNYMLRRDALLKGRRKPSQVVYY